MYKIVQQPLQQKGRTNIQSKIVHQNISLNCKRQQFRTAKVFASKDEVLKCLSTGGEVSVITLDATNLVAEACRRHKTSATCSAALGRTIMSAILLQSFGKDDEESLQVTFDGNGPIGRLIGVASNGQVRGMCDDPTPDPPLKPNGKLDVGKVVGQGNLSVSRNADWRKEPAVSTVPIQTGEIAEDITYYLAQSEQRPAAVGVGVLLGPDRVVAAAGGFYVEVLPDASDETVSKLEKNIGQLPPPSNMIMSGSSPRDIVDKLLEGIGVESQSNQAYPTYGPCDRERMIRMLSAIGKDECMDIIKEQGMIEAKDEFCKETYQFKEPEVLKWFEDVEKEEQESQI